MITIASSYVTESDHDRSLGAEVAVIVCCLVIGWPAKSVIVCRPGRGAPSTTHADGLTRPVSGRSGRSGESGEASRAGPAFC